MKKRRDKKYVPKHVGNPFIEVFGGMSDMHAEQTTTIQAKTASAVQAMVQGRGERVHFDLIVGAVNIANVMCEMGIGPEYREEILAAHNAMLEAGKRALKSGKFGFTGDELRRINEFTEIHDAQLRASRALDVNRAAMEVARRVRYRINSTSVRRELEREAA